jgi:hypothetical protein
MIGSSAARTMDAGTPRASSLAMAGPARWTQGWAGASWPNMNGMGYRRDGNWNKALQLFEWLLQPSAQTGVEVETERLELDFHNARCP